MTFATLRSGKRFCCGSGNTGSGPSCEFVSKLPLLPQAERRAATLVAARSACKRLVMMRSKSCKESGDDQGKHRQCRQCQPHGHHGGPAIDGVDEVVDEGDDEGDD